LRDYFSRDAALEIQSLFLDIEEQFCFRQLPIRICLRYGSG
jgi:hypothetical protein